MFKNLSKLKKFPLFVWYRNVLLALDFLTNAIMFGDPRETISSVLGKMMQDGTCKACHAFCGVLSIIFMEKEHCKNAILPNVGRGSDNDYSPIPGLRRKWSNGFVIMLLVMLVYKEEIFNFIGSIT